MKSISGTWELCKEYDTSWRPVSVPGCWEQAGVPKTDPGPYWYRTHFFVPEEYNNQRVWLRFGAVSYSCRVLVNGRTAGEHTGMWDAFTVEVTDFIQLGADAELLVWVEKPASLTAGPDSPHVAGHFPLRGTLSGFLPYVWGHAFGGIWQDVKVFTTGKRIIEDFWVHGDPDGQGFASVTVSSPGSAQITIHDPQGQVVWDQTIHIEHAAQIKIQIPTPSTWSLQSPNLYIAKINLPGSDECSMCFGLRSFETQGKALLLNDQPVYPRMILSWGWYAHLLRPDPGPEQVRTDMLRLRGMGYNGIKLCLWFPPPYYFDLADEMGMLLWVELPMWQPLLNDDFRRQTKYEYDRLVRQARQHPSVVLYTLGCELDQAVDGEFLGQLYTQTKELTAGALVRDNSGSSEAYGGPMYEHADFDDNHLYCELQYLRPTLDAFAAGWRVEKPWLMGEFCDYDTFPNNPTRWWINPDPCDNPQGSRWEMRAITHKERLRQNGMQGRVKELCAASHRQALVHRKYTLETVRMRGDLSGYVVTGETDTPVSTAGMWDADGNIKFIPSDFTPSNQDLVLSLGWDRRRAWVAGGDRPSPRDRYNHVSGSLVRIHLVGSNYSQKEGIARVKWEIAFPDQTPFASSEGHTPFKLTSGHVQGLAVIEFYAPEVMTPRQAILKAQVSLKGQTTRNTWPLWFFPANTWTGIPRFGLFDPHNLLSDLPNVSGEQCVPGFEGVSVIVCSGWTELVDAFVRRGGKAIMLEGLNGLAGPLPVVPVPYWREALKLVENHPTWGDFPHGYNPDMQFYSMAPDCALDTAGFEGKAIPIFRRLDMRGMELLEYAVELQWGQGKLIATTLRFSGGLGDQPNSIRYCPAGQHLLANWVRSLHP